MDQKQILQKNMKPDYDQNSSGSNDNILQKKSNAPSQFNVVDRLNRSRELVQKPKVIQKRSTSTSSQFKSRAAMRILGIPQQDTPD